MSTNDLTEAELQNLTERLEGFARSLSPREQAFLRSALAQAAQREEVAAYGYEYPSGDEPVHPASPRPPVFRLR